MKNLLLLSALFFFLTNLYCQNSCKERASSITFNDEKTLIALFEEDTCEDVRAKALGKLDPEKYLDLYKKYSKTAHVYTSGSIGGHHIQSIQLYQHKVFMNINQKYIYEILKDSVSEVLFEKCLKRIINDSIYIDELYLNAKQDFVREAMSQLTTNQLIISEIAKNKNEKIEKRMNAIKRLNNVELLNYLIEDRTEDKIIIGHALDRLKVLEE